MTILNLLSVAVVSALTIVASINLHQNLGIQISTNEVVELTCNRSGAYCASDCATLMVCAGTNPKPISTIPCSSPNQYCVGNGCTPVADPSCPNGNAFTCTDDGIFPEPSDCRRSRLCEDGESKLYECPAGYVFNSKLNICQLGSTPCNRIDCSRATAMNPYIVYASNPAYYALCVNNGNGHIQTFMFKCPYERFEIFDTSLFSCRFNCAAKGYFQNPANCSEYFHCNGASASTKPTMLTCQANYVFDGTRCNSDSSTCQYPPASVEEVTQEPPGTTQ